MSTIQKLHLRLQRIEAAAAAREDASTDISGLLRECAFDEDTLREVGLLDVCRSGAPVTIESLSFGTLLWLSRLGGDEPLPTGGHRKAQLARVAAGIAGMSKAGGGRA